LTGRFVFACHFSEESEFLCCSVHESLTLLFFEIVTLNKDNKNEKVGEKDLFLKIQFLIGVGRVV
jgi:hypothetical protein